MNNIKKKTIAIFTILAIVVSGLVANSVFAYSQDELYDTVWRLINMKYVDQTNNGQDWQQWRHKYDGKLKTNEDAYMAISTMLASLNDPYTKFLDPKDFAEETSSIKGSLKGIGIQIAVREGKLLVIAPIEGSPAEQVGLLADDEILEINDASTKGITVDKAADKIRGEAGTTVKLLIKRKDQAPQTFIVTRAEIEIKSVSTKPPYDTSKIPDNIGYVRLSSFISKNASKEIQQIFMNYKCKDGIIIDLRSNPGGLLTNAINISDMLLQGGKIVSTVDRDSYKETQRATRSYVTDKPVVVLINKGSASASEIFSGALKDNRRATIVGEQSFGKGLVQEINKLPEGSGVNITIQKYLTPNDIDINKKGITPDVVVEFKEENVKNKDDIQLKKAIEILQAQSKKCAK